MKAIGIIYLTVELCLMCFLIVLFSPMAIINIGWYSEGIKCYVNKTLDKAVNLDFCTKEEADELRIK